MTLRGYSSIPAYFKHKKYWRQLDTQKTKKDQFHDVKGIKDAKVQFHAVCGIHANAALLACPSEQGYNDPMKFFHLSDLHIGKSVNGFSMIEEQKHVFGQIIGYVQTERPAAVVIAGDVYDRAVPSTEAVQVFDDFLTALAGEDVAVMLISGNHDSPERLHFASRLLSDKRLFFYGVFDGSVQKVTLSDEYGEVYFWLLPFIKPAMVRVQFAGHEIESYTDAVAAALAAAEIDYTVRNVLVSHQFYVKSGVESLRSESELDPVGGLDAVDAGIIERFDYAALGHLHRRQSVGAEHIRYCGSPMKYSFSERQHEKSITVVEMREKNNPVSLLCPTVSSVVNVTAESALTAKNPAENPEEQREFTQNNKPVLPVSYITSHITINTLPLAPLHDMREIRGELDKLISNEISSLADKEDYLRVILTDEEQIIDPMGKLRSVYPNIMSLVFENIRTSIDISAITADAEKAARLSPYDLFNEFFLESQGSVMSKEQSEIVRELLDELL